MLEKVDAKVTPEMAVFVQLDEMNGRLAKLTSLIDSTIARGRRTTSILSVTVTPQRVAFEAIAYTMFNDGPNTVYTSDDGPGILTNLEAGLAANESESIDLRQRKLVEFWIVAAAGGTATVRLRKLT